MIGNGIEVIGKGTITRPALYREVNGVPVHIDAFDDSFPSGHMMRGVIVAFAIGLMFTRSWKWAALWAFSWGPHSCSSRRTRSRMSSAERSSAASCSC